MIVTIEELKSFYEKRCRYIQQIIDAIDNIVSNYKKEMQNTVIPKSNDLIEQIIILKNLNIIELIILLISLKKTKF